MRIISKQEARSKTVENVLASMRIEQLTPSDFVVMRRVVAHLAEAIRPVQVTEQVGRFLECLKQGPLSTREAMERLELQHRPTFSANYLLPALNAGLVEMTQPESPRSPTQKYRLIAPALRSGPIQGRSGGMRQ